MHFDWVTFALQVVNFSVLLLLLNRFLYRPVLRVVDKRRAEIEKQYADAAAAEAEAKAKLDGLDAARAGIAAEREALLAAASAEAARIAEGARLKAEEAAKALMGDGQRLLEEERQRLLAEAKQAALGLGADLAGRLLAEVPPESWLLPVERRLRLLPETERAALRQDLTVVTAAPLAEEAKPEWLEHLRNAIGIPDGPVAFGINFETDPSLLTGVELHFASGIWRFSGRSGLASLRAAIEARGDIEATGDIEARGDAA